MNGSYKGMLTDEVKKIVNIIDSNIKESKKLDTKLDSLKDDIKSAYKSSINSKQISRINKEILNSHFVKIRNIESYKNYTEKKIAAYISAGKRNELRVKATTYQNNNVKKI